MKGGICVEYFGELAKIRPRELKNIIENRPIVYIPSGIMEWHDDQNPMGLDTLKVEEIALRTAKITGGAVHMPSYIGVGAFYGKFSFGKECELEHGGVNYDEAFVKEYLLRTYEQLERFGFELIVVIYGHTNGGNINAHEQSAREYMKKEGTKAKILAVSEIAPAVKYRYKLRDHAAKYETSFMMAKYPELVKMEDIDSDHGEWWGRDPREEASAEVGEDMYRKISEEIAKMVQKAQSATREEMMSITFAAEERCWECCQNIKDLKTDFWKGDSFWEDPGCNICSWRSKGLAEYLVSLKGYEWTERIVNGWCRFIDGEDPLTSGTADSIREIKREFDNIK